MRITMKHFENGDRKVEWDATPTKPGKISSDEGWIGYTIFLKKREVQKCQSEGCEHLTPNDLCKTCAKKMDPAVMLHPQFRLDGGNGVSAWLDDPSDEARGV